MFTLEVLLELTPSYKSVLTPFTSRVFFPNPTRFTTEGCSVQLSLLLFWPPFTLIMNPQMVHVHTRSASWAYSELWICLHTFHIQSFLSQSNTLHYWGLLSTTLSFTLLTIGGCTHQLLAGTPSLSQARPFTQACRLWWTPAAFFYSSYQQWAYQLLAGTPPLLPSPPFHQVC